MAETKTINLEVQSNLGSLKSQLREAQAEVAALSDKFGATSQAAAEAAKKAADLKDRIQDAKALTDAFNPDAKFTSLTRSIGGALDGFQAFEGALGLIGVESEDLQKTLLKVQSAMAFSQGIQGALEAKDSFIQLGSVVKNAFSAMTTASKAFLVGGIGLVIAAVGLIVANYDEWFGASKKVAEQQKRISEQAKEQRENIAKESGEFATLISRLKNTNSGTKEREDLIKKINGQYGTTLKNIKDEAKFQESLNKELASYLEYQKAKYQLQKNEEFIVKNLEKQDELRAKIAKAQKDRDKAIEDGAGKQKRTLEEGIITYVNLNEEADKTLAKANETISESNKELEAAEKRFNAYGSAANNASKNVDKLTNSGTKYVEQQRKDAAKEEKVFFDANVEAFDASAIDINEIDEQLYSDMAARDALEIAQMQAHNQEMIDGEIQLQQDLTDAAVQGSADRVNAALAEQQQKEAIQKQNIDFALQGIAIVKGLFEQNKNVQKAAVIAESALGIAKMIISNKTANLGALATPQAILTSGLSAAPVIAANNITTGLGIAANILATGKALRALGGGSAPSAGGVGGGSGVGGGGMSPSFNVVGNSGMNQLAQIQQTPVQAYVVSGEVTSAQALDRNRIKNATL